jgi:hypothetical protein
MKRLTLLLLGAGLALPALALRCQVGQVELLLGGQAGTQCSGETRAAKPATGVAEARVGVELQRQRDEDRRSILLREQEREQALLLRLQQARPADADAVARTQANLQALQREIARLPASPGGPAAMR